MPGVLEEIKISGKRGFDELNEEKTFNKLGDILKDVKDGLERDLKNPDAPISKFRHRRGEITLEVCVKGK